MRNSVLPIRRKLIGSVFALLYTVMFSIAGVQAQCPTITVSGPAQATVGTAYSGSFTAMPAGAYTFAIDPTTLPTGVTLNASTGALSGTPSVAGVYFMTVYATNAAGCTGSAQVAFAVGSNATNCAGGTATFALSGKPGADFQWFDAATGGSLIASQPGTLSQTLNTFVSGLNRPYSVAFDAGGNMYVSDHFNNQVLRVRPNGTTVALSIAGLDRPAGLVVVGNSLYIANYGVHRVLRHEITTGTTTVFAGNGLAGSTGDGGAAASAQLNFPVDLDTDGTSLFIADQSNHKIRAVNLSTGVITTFAGTGTSGFVNGAAATAQFNAPTGIAFNGGTLFVADRSNNAIRSISGGTVATVAGTGALGFTDGPAATAQFRLPSDIAFDRNGDMYIADRSNNRIRVLSGGNVSTFIGDGTAAFSGDGSTTFPAGQVATPTSVAFDAAGNIYVADHLNNRIRRVVRSISDSYTTAAVTSTTTFHVSNGGARFPVTVTVPIAQITTTSPLASVGVGSAVNISLATSAFSGTVSIILEDDPADGLDFPTGFLPTTSTATTTITGTAPSTAGTYGFKVTATDGTCTAEKSFTIVVNCPTITSSVGGDANWVLRETAAPGVNTRTVSPSGGLGTYNFTLVSVTRNGNPITTPSWANVTGASASATLSIASNGTEVGADAGSYVFTYSFVDATTNCPGSANATVSFTLACPVTGTTAGTNVVFTPASGSTINIPIGGTLPSVSAAFPGAGGVTYSFVNTSATTLASLGLGIDAATGNFTGTPTATGTANITVTATSTATNCTATATYTVTVSCPTVTVSVASSTTPEPNFTAIKGQTFNADFDATAIGIPSFTFSIAPTGATTSLPAWITSNFDATTGVLNISPIPAAAVEGVYNFAISAVNGPCTGQATYSLTVGCPTPTFTATNVTVSPLTGSPAIIQQATPITAGRAITDIVFDATFAPVGNALIGLSFSSGQLPNGITYNPGARRLSGTPTQVDSDPLTPGNQPFRFQLTAVDNFGCVYTLQLEMEVACPTAFTATPADASVLAGATAGQAYSADFNVTFGAGLAPYSIVSINSNSVTAGTTTTALASDLEVVAGAAEGDFRIQTKATPGVVTAVPGTYTLEIVVADKNNCQQTLTYDVTVACPTYTLTPASGTIGGPYISGETITPVTITLGGTNANLAPYTVTTAPVTLPAGLSAAINATTGVVTISGRVEGPAAVHSFGITVTDKNGCLVATGATDYNFEVICPTITFSPTSGADPHILPGGIVSTSYSQTITASPAGTGYTYNYTTDPLTLPDGLSLNSSTGEISGTPTAAGTYNFTVRAQLTGTYGTNCFANRNYRITVACPVLNLTNIGVNTVGNSTINLTAVTNYTAGTPAGTVVESAPGTYNFSVAVGTSAQLGGLVVDAATGVITGTVTDHTGSPYTLNIRVENNNDPSCFFILPVTVNVTCPTITVTAAGSNVTGGNTANIIVGRNYDGLSAALTIADMGAAGPGTITFDFEPSIPVAPLSTLAIDSLTGVITGSINQTGIFTIVVRARITTPLTSCFQDFTLTLNVACPPNTAANWSATGTLAPATVGQAYTSAAVTVASITGGGGSGTYTYSASGLVGNLAIDPATGVISAAPFNISCVGLPASATVTVTATDATAPTACTYTQVVTIPLVPPTITLGAISATGTAGAAYSDNVVAAGGLAPYTYAVTAGTLPTGLVLATNGALNGTLTAAGTFNFTVTATDANGCTGSQAYTITVTCPMMTLTPDTGTLANATLNTAYGPVVVSIIGGGTAPYALSGISGVPQGMTLAIVGNEVRLSGTPERVDSDPSTVALDAFTIAFTVTDTYNCPAATPLTGSFTLTVGCTPITFPTVALPDGIATNNYSESVATATGALNTFTYSIVSIIGERLPAGLTLNANGTITGTIDASAASVTPYVFTVRATDVSGCSETQQFSITVNCTPFGFLFTSTTVLTPCPGGVCGTATDNTLFLGEEFLATLGVDAAAPTTSTPVYSLVAGTLPPGTNLTQLATGTLRIVPTVPGTYEFTLRASVGFCNSDAQTFRVVVECNPARALVLNQPTLPVTQPAIGTPAANTIYAAVSQPFSATIALSNAVAPGFVNPPAIVGLPGWVGTSFNATTGVLTLTGTPTDNGFVGTTSFDVTIANVYGCSATQTFTLDVRCGKLAFADFTGAPVGAAVPEANLLVGTTVILRFLEVLPISNRGNFTYQILFPGGQTELPFGLNFDPVDARFFGTPEETVTGFEFVVVATDINTGCTDAQAYRLNITCPIFANATPVLPAATAGVPYEDYLVVTNGAAPYFFVALGGTLDLGAASGLELDTDGSVTGVAGAIYGTPQIVGTYTIQFGVVDFYGCSDVFTSTITINCPTVAMSVGGSPVTGLSSVAGSTPTRYILTEATVGSAYNLTLGASNGIAPYTLSITAGALPDGLTFNNGVISGTSTRGGIFDFTVRAEDKNGCFVDHAFRITAVCPGVTLSPAAGALSAATAAQAYSATFSTTGGTAPYTYTLTAGALPAGISLVANALTGTPTVVGPFSFSITSTDANGCTVTNAYTLQVNCPTLTFAPASLATVFSNIPMAPQSIVASGGIAPYTYVLAPGSAALPAGISLSAAGVLSGTPTVVGTFNFTVRATDANGCSTDRAYALVVNCGPIVVAPTTLPNATAANFYSTSLSATGGNAPYTYSVVAGSALPAGLTLSTTGVISGTPTVTGTRTFTVRVQDSKTPTPCFVNQVITLTINCPVIAIAPSTLPNGAAGAMYSANLSASGGVGAYSFSVSAGALPTGLTLATNGAISGLASVPGTYNFTVRAADANGCEAFRPYTVEVTCPSLNFTPSVLPSATAAASYTHSLTANVSGGIAPYSFALLPTSSPLPTGLTLSSNGTISGTTNLVGTFSFTVRVTDANRCTGTATYTLTVNCSNITFATTSLANATLGASYFTSIEAANGVAPYTYAVVDGVFPPGLFLSFTGAITGRPTEGGTFNFVVRVTDANGCTASRSYSISVATSACANLSLGSITSTPVLNASYFASISALGGTAPYTFALASGNLPTGVTLSTSGFLFGTASAAGSFTFTVRVTDAAGCTTTRAYTLTVSSTCPALTITPASLPSPALGVAYSANLTTTGGVAPYSYTVISGQLPAGLTLSIPGTISGTPTAGGVFTFSVRVVDFNGCSATQAYTLNIAAPAGCALTFSPAGSVIDRSSNGLAIIAGRSAFVPITVTDATGAPVSATFSIASGSLPTGLFLSSSGTIAGTPRSAGTFSFTVRATQSTGCSATKAYTVIVGAAAGTTTLAEGTSPEMAGTDAAQWSVYPNPSAGRWNVSASGLRGGNVTLTVFDMAGRQVYMQAVNTNGSLQHEIALESLSSGAYILRVVHEGGNQSFKLLKD